MTCALRVDRLVLATNHCNFKTFEYFNDQRRLLIVKATNLFLHSFLKVQCNTKFSEAVSLIAEAVSMVDELQFEIDYPMFIDTWTLMSGLMGAATLVVQSIKTFRVSAKVGRKDFCVSATFTAPTIGR